MVVLYLSMQGVQPVCQWHHHPRWEQEHHTPWHFCHQGAPLKDKMNLPPKQAGPFRQVPLCQSVGSKRNVPIVAVQTMTLAQQ